MVQTATIADNTRDATCAALTRMHAKIHILESRNKTQTVYPYAKKGGGKSKPYYCSSSSSNSYESGKGNGKSKQYGAAYLADISEVFDDETAYEVAGEQEWEEEEEE